MFRVLLADDDYEDRELLKLEIQLALGPEEPDLRFYEAVSITQAKETLRERAIDLLTLDIEFDRMSEGIEALPELFETYPTLNIIVVSGKLNKGEVMEQLFRFTKDNVLKGKRWARHFDVLDKKDTKTEALRRAHSFAFNQKDVADRLRDLLLLAESFLDEDESDKCLEVYQKIQNLAPGEFESNENIHIFRGAVSPEHSLELYRKGEKIVASLLLGHQVETRLKTFTRKTVGRHSQGLLECLHVMERAHRINPFKKDIFLQMVRVRNKAIHHPSTIDEKDFDFAIKSLRLLEAKI
ncbi:MAG: response regulator [Nitrospirae bacterium]|nr:response regulator [Nitrospirota bacterium]